MNYHLGVQKVAIRNRNIFHVNLHAGFLSRSNEHAEISVGGLVVDMLKSDVLKMKLRRQVGVCELEKNNRSVHISE